MKITLSTLAPSKSAAGILVKPEMYLVGNLFERNSRNFTYLSLNTRLAITIIVKTPSCFVSIDARSMHMAYMSGQSEVEWPSVL